MSNRPDIDEDARRLRQRPVDQWNAAQFLAGLTATGDRGRVLAHLAAAALHSAVRGDIAELRSRGILALPICAGSGSTMTIESADRLRRVQWSHSLERQHIDIGYYHVNRSQQDLLLTTRLPAMQTADYSQLPSQVRKCADDIRAFVLHGELPGSHDTQESDS